MTKDTWQGNALFAASLAIPLLGCVLAVYFKDEGWLVLLAPLVVFMEGAFLLGGIAFFVVEWLIGK